MVITTGCFALETNDVMEIGNGVGSSLAKYNVWPLHCTGHHHQHHPDNDDGEEEDADDDEEI